MNTDEMIAACMAAGCNVDFTSHCGVWIWYFPANGHATFVQADTLAQAYELAKNNEWVING